MAMQPYHALRATAEVKADMRAEITAAITFLGAMVQEVTITPHADAIGPDHVYINIRAHVPAPGQVIAFDSDVGADVPPDIMSRPRGQA